MIGSEYSRENLAQNYGRLITSICRKMIVNSEDARDAAQDIWLKVIERMPEFRGESKLSTWIYQIAVRSVIDFSRHQKTVRVRELHALFQGEEIDPPYQEDFENKIWLKEICELLHWDDRHKAYHGCARFCTLWQRLAGRHPGSGRAAR